MRAVLFLLLLACAASAQFEKSDAELARCERSCCESAGGNWSAGACAMSVYTSGYNACEDRCLENATGSIRGSAPGTSFCCAPGAILGVIGVCAFLIRR